MSDLSDSEAGTQECFPRPRRVPHGRRVPCWPGCDTQPLSLAPRGRGQMTYVLLHNTGELGTRKARGVFRENSRHLREGWV